MYILGISCWYHDSAACLVHDGEIVAAVQEERFTRIKHDPSFPINAIRYCLDYEGVGVKDIDFIVFYEDSDLKFRRVKKTWITFFPKTIPVFFESAYSWFKYKKDSNSRVYEEMKSNELLVSRDKIITSEHHFSHAASAFYPSPYNSAAVLVMDGVGEFDTTSIWHGRGNRLTKLKEVVFPNSIGLLYSTITAFLGFKVNSGEYKVMGLAPYGTPRFKDALVKLYNVGNSPEDFKLDMEYFGFPYSGTMYTSKMELIFGVDARLPESELTQVHMDIASSLQWCIEDLVLKFAQRALNLTGESHLCLAGGVALNCVANGRVDRELGLGNRMWIQPASGDAGNAIGAALGFYYDKMTQTRSVNPDDSMSGSYLGPSYGESDIQAMVSKYGAIAEKYDDDSLSALVANKLAVGCVVGWHKGRAEFGPRSLGNRSILGDPRNVDMQSTMNLKIKFRESFRPFAPAVLEERLNDYFDTRTKSPYMLLVAPVAEKVREILDDKNDSLFGIDLLKVVRSRIPAVTHVDYSARVQTVDGKFNPGFKKLLSDFYKLTDCPVLINTSFNVRGEPIVLTPEDSYRCFMRTDMDVLVIENFVFMKAAQPTFLDSDKWKEEFVLD